MQNNRVEREIFQIGEKWDEYAAINKQEWVYGHWSFNTFEIGIMIIKIIILFMVGKMVFQKNVSMGELVGIITIISYLATLFQRFIDMMKEYMKRGVDLKRFWNFLDTSPKIGNLYE